MIDNVLTVKNLKKSFKNKGKEIKAVKGINFEVHKGEILGFLGVNGAGKSTTINMLMGLLTPDSGNIKIFKKDMTKNWEYVRNKINVAAAYERLSEGITVMQNLKVYAGLYGVKKTEDKINKLAKLFEIEDLLDRKTNKLSSGQHTKVVLVKTFLNDPELILMDECTIGLDPEAAERTRQIIMDYRKRTGCSIIFTSHYMYEVEEMCDRILFMNKGQIIAEGTPDEIKKNMTKQIIELKLLNGNKEIKKLLNGKKVKVLHLSNNVVRFEIDTKIDNLQKILSAIEKENIEFHDIHIKKPTLDDFFIHIARSNSKSHGNENKTKSDNSKKGAKK